LLIFLKKKLKEKKYKEIFEKRPSAYEARRLIKPKRPNRKSLYIQIKKNG
jgi:hypothetical protein